jgi:capsular exopolysaccharide synthesis family protein
MERIQEAIEKAKRERQVNQDAEGKTDEPVQDGYEVHESETVNKNGIVKQEDLSPGSQQEKRSVRVKYSQTRSVNINAQTLKDLRIVAGFTHDKRSEPYRQLRGQILNKMRESNWRTLAITSPNSGAGRTVTAINLAISLSMEVNQTVLLVDMDLRQPSVAACLGIDDVEYGLVDYVNNEQPLENILIHPGFERLVLLPGTPQANASSEVLSSPEMKSVISELINRYPSRLIIFDLPAVLSHDDALVFSPTCDATLMVVEEGGTNKADLERSYQLLEGANIIGSVMNKVRYT